METKKCPACGENIPVGTLFCPMCGERLTDNGQEVSATRSTDTANRPQSVAPQQPSARKSAEDHHIHNFRPLPLAIMATAIVIIAVAGYFIFGRSKKGDDRQATDWHALAVNYLAANSIDEDAAYICADDERHCVYHLQKDNLCKNTLVRYDLQKGISTTILSCPCENDDIELDSIEKWGETNDDRCIWLMADNGGFGGSAATNVVIYDTYTQRGKVICSGRIVELKGSIIECTERELVRFNTCMADSDYMFTTTYYDWDGDEIVPKQYVGTIGSYPVVMELVSDGEHMFGSYYYRRYGPEHRMELEGTIDNRQLLLYGYSYDTGDRRLIETISAVYVGDEMTGTWHNVINGNTLRVNLTLK